MRTNPNGTVRRRWRFVPAVALTAVLGVAGACGSDSETGSATTVSTPTSETLVDDADTEALTDAVDELVVVCRDRDQSRLRDLSSTGVGDQIRGRDRDSLFADNLDAISVHSREVVIDGDTATVTVTLEVVIDGETSEVERVFVYERVDGVWVLAEVPDCIFK